MGESYLRESMGEAKPYTSDFTIEDFRQIVKDLEDDYQRRAKRRRETPDNSWAQIVEIAKQERGLFKLDNGLFVSPDWCRHYLEACDAWTKREDKIWSRD